MVAGHMKSPREPHAARGPRVGQHWSSACDALLARAYKYGWRSDSLSLAAQTSNE